MHERATKLAVSHRPSRATDAPGGALYGPDVSFGEGGHAGALGGGQVLTFLPDGKIFTAGGRQDPTVNDDSAPITTATRINPDGPTPSASTGLRWTISERS